MRTARCACSLGLAPLMIPDAPSTFHSNGPAHSFCCSPRPVMKLTRCVVRARAAIRSRESKWEDCPARCTSNPRNGWVGSMNATGSKPCESPWALRCNSHCNIGPVREKDAFDCALAGNKQRRGSSAAAQLLGFGLQSAAGFYRSRNSWLSIAQQVSWVSFDDLPVCRPGPVFSATGSAERAMNVKIVRRGRYKIQPSAYPNEACHTSPKKCCALAIRTDLRALQIAEQDRRSGRICRNYRNRQSQSFRHFRKSDSTASRLRESRHNLP